MRQMSDEPFFKFLEYHLTLKRLIQLTHVAAGMVDREKRLENKRQRQGAFLVLVQQLV